MRKIKRKKLCNENVYTCYYCNTSYKEKSLLENHVATVHSSESNYLSNCGRNEANILCDHCKISFCNLQYLNQHIAQFHNLNHQTSNNKKKTHKRIQEYICDYCIQVFKRKAALIRHICQIHPKNEKLKKNLIPCDHCPSYFKNSQRLSRHITLCHIRNREDVVAEGDGEIIDILSNLKALNSQSKTDILARAIGSSALDIVPNVDIKKVNITKKGNRNIFKCDLCNYKTCRLSFLKRHMIAHSTAKPYECKQCSTKFRYSFNLTNHIKITHNQRSKNVNKDQLSEFLNFRNNTRSQQKKKSNRKKPINNNKSAIENIENPLSDNINPCLEEQSNSACSLLDITNISCDDEALNNILQEITSEPPSNLGDIDDVLNNASDKQCTLEQQGECLIPQLENILLEKTYDNKIDNCTPVEISINENGQIIPKGNRNISNEIIHDNILNNKFYTIDIPFNFEKQLINNNNIITIANSNEYQIICNSQLINTNSSHRSNNLATVTIDPNILVPECSFEGGQTNLNKVTNAINSDNRNESSTADTIFVEIDNDVTSDYNLEQANSCGLTLYDVDGNTLLVTQNYDNVNLNCNNVVTNSETCPTATLVEDTNSNESPNPIMYNNINTVEDDNINNEIYENMLNINDNILLSQEDYLSADTYATKIIDNNYTFNNNIELSSKAISHLLSNVTNTPETNSANTVVELLNCDGVNNLQTIDKIDNSTECIENNMIDTDTQQNIPNQETQFEIENPTSTAENVLDNNNVCVNNVYDNETLSSKVLSNLLLNVTNTPDTPNSMDSIVELLHCNDVQIDHSFREIENNIFDTEIQQDISNQKSQFEIEKNTSAAEQLLDNNYEYNDNEALNSKVLSHLLSNVTNTPEAPNFLQHCDDVNNLQVDQSFQGIENNSIQKPFCLTTVSTMRNDIIEQLSVNENENTEAKILDLLSQRSFKELIKSNYKHKCDICKKHFYKRGNLKEHLQLIHNKVELLCDHCGKILSSKKNLIAHIKTHYLPKTVTCQVCGATLARTSLNAHMTLHNNKTPYLCLLCGKRFRLYNAKIQHIKKHHINQESKSTKNTLIDMIDDLIEVDNCDNFKPPQVLIDTINNLIEEECNKRASAKPKTIKEPLVLTCDICQKVYTHRSNYLRHQRSHKAIKDFTCTCGTTFDTKIKLNRHKKRQCKRFVCNLCNKSFITEIQYNTHYECMHNLDKLKNM